jgi:hypothetical protein
VGCFYRSRCTALQSTLLLRKGRLALLDVWTAVDYWLLTHGCHLTLAELDADAESDVAWELF